MTVLARDLRYALRGLRRSPGFTAVAVATLALGIGATAVIFTWTKATVLNPLPGVRDPGRLVTMNGVQAERSGLSDSYSEYRFVRDHASTLSGAIAYEFAPMNLSRSGPPEIVSGGIVTANYFEFLGVRIQLGRGFVPAEGARPGAGPVVVLSDRLWRRRFAGRSGVLGTRVDLNGHPFTVVGVAAPGFFGSYGGLAQELWVPLSMSAQVYPGAGDLMSNDWGWLQIMGRLKPGVSMDRAQAEIRVLARQIAAAQPDRLKNWTLRVDPLSRSARGIESSLAPFLRILLAVTGLVLLIACANVASLLLARASARRREVAVRLAIGAGSGRIVRQLLTEGAALAAMGGAAGLGLAAVAARFLPALIPPMGAPLGLDVSIDLRVVAFTFLVTSAAVLLFGLAPALQARRFDLVAAIKNDSAERRRSRRPTLRDALVVAQVALSLVALVGAGLFLRSLRNRLGADPGFERRNALVASFDVSGTGVDSSRTPELVRGILSRVQALPGVVSASVTTYVPMGLSGGGNSRRVAIDGYVPREGETLDLVTDEIGPGYLATMRIPLVRGRGFTLADREDAPDVAIVNETLARRYFSGREAVGGILRIGDRPRRVVGVARNIVYRAAGEDPQPSLYLPILQEPDGRMSLVVRTVGDPLRLRGPVEAAIHSVLPDLALLNVATLEQHTASTSYMERGATILLSSFGLLALGLTVVGIFGLLSYDVSRRTREIGIRGALGAGRVEILALVLRGGMIRVGAGLAIGTAGGFLVGRVLEGTLYGVEGSDPVTFAAAAAVLAGSAFVACAIPARRAARVEPMTALRYE
jgi:macrolide transport system ATP-binding/permease protein